MSGNRVSAAQTIGFSTINGLPAHVLLVHAAVVFVPLAAVGAVAALHPPTARRFGLLMPAVSAVALLAVLAAMNAGGWLQNHVPNTALVRRHTQLAGQLWPFSAGVLILSLVTWWLARRATPIATSRGRSRQYGGVATTVIVGIVTVAVSLGSVVEVVRIGESGSRAAWHDHFSPHSIGHDS